jgi:hypothetical protein
MDISRRTGPTRPGIIPPGAGGVVGFEDYGGISGGSDYHRAFQTSLLARFNPEALQNIATRGWGEEIWEQKLNNGQRPAAVSMVGDDVFPETQFTPTVRNKLLDTRGEAAYAPMRGTPPEGASDVGWRAYAIENGPSSTGLACGTCNPVYSRVSSAQRQTTGALTPRGLSSYYRTPLAVLKAAYYI